MEVLGTQVKPMPFDPIGSTRAGMELANLGLQPLRIAQELKQAQIAEQEAQRSLDMRRFEDTARRTLGELARKHSTRGPDGRMRIDRKAVIAEARAANLDPTFIAEYEAKELANEAAGLRTGAEQTSFLKKFFDDEALVIAKMGSESEAAQHLQGKVKQISEQMGVPFEVAAQYAANHYGIGQGGNLITTSRRLAEARSISPLQERELIASGVGAEDVNPRSAASVAARQFIASQGMQVPEGISLAQMRNDPRFKTVIAAFDKRTTGVIPGEATRVGGIEQAATAGAERAVYQDALALEGRYSTAITRPGATIEDILARVITQPAERSRIEGAIAAYNAANPGTEISLRDGAPSVFARLRQQDAKLKGLQTSGADVATATDLTAVGREKIPKDVQAVRDADRTNVLRTEYDTKVRELRSKPNDRRLQSDVDALVRELRGMKVNVPGSSDILRGAKVEPPKTTGIRLKRLSDGKTVIAPNEERARAAVNSRLFERL